MVKGAFLECLRSLVHPYVQRFQHLQHTWDVVLTKVQSSGEGGGGGRGGEGGGGEGEGEGGEKEGEGGEEKGRGGGGIHVHHIHLNVPHVNVIVNHSLFLPSSSLTWRHPPVPHATAHARVWPHESAPRTP